MVDGVHDQPTGMEGDMPRLTIVSLLTATAFVLIPLAAQAQAPGHQPPGREATLPEGAGKALVEGACVACHQTDMITQSSGYTREGWKELAATMIDLSGNPAGLDPLTQYLATH